MPVAGVATLGVLSSISDPLRTNIALIGSDGFATRLRDVSGNESELSLSRLSSTSVIGSAVSVVVVVLEGSGSEVTVWAAELAAGSGSVSGSLGGAAEGDLGPCASLAIAAMPSASPAGSSP